MHQFDHILSTLEKEHPLNKNGEWLREIISAPLRKKQRIPEPTKDPKQQAFSAFCTIQYISEIRDRRLTEGAIVVAANNNPTSLAQIVRALHENTAWLGHACYLTQNWPPIEACEDLKLLLTGTRRTGDDRQSLNILTSIDKTNKVLKKVSPEYVPEDLGKNLIRSSYDMVSEFVHPNFDSNYAELEYEEDEDFTICISEEKIYESVTSLLNHMNWMSIVYALLHNLTLNRIREANKAVENNANS